MHIKRTDISKTRIKLTISSSDDELKVIKNKVVTKLGKNSKIAGFRTGKAPLHVIEKHLDQSSLQSEFLDEAINFLYTQAIKKEAIRSLGRPEVSLSKFVPFTTLEFQAEVDILGVIKVADYKKIKMPKPTIKINAKDVNEVLDSLKTRSAERKSTSAPAKSGDEVVIDFEGVDSKKQPISGADGKDYPLILGSNNFIPGFETNLIGLKKGEEKTFTLTFPKDYGVSALANKKVTFSAKIKEVRKLIEPKLDDNFASSVGPFKTLSDLKVDIEKHLSIEKQQQANAKFEAELVKQIVDGSELELPKSLVDEQIDRLKAEVRQNIVYKGQTWQEMLDSLKLTEEEYNKSQLLPEAKIRVKTGLVIAEISNLEKIQLTQEEIDNQMQELKNQYKDKQMQEELNKPEARQEIASRMITQKTINKLVNIATKN